MSLKKQDVFKDGYARLQYGSYWSDLQVISCEYSRHPDVYIVVVISREEVLSQETSEKCVKHMLKECVFFWKMKSN